MEHMHQSWRVPVAGPDDFEFGCCPRCAGPVEVDVGMDEDDPYELPGLVYACGTCPWEMPVLLVDGVLTRSVGPAEPRSC